MAERVWHKHYDSGVPAEIDFDDQTVVDYFQDAVASCEDRTALIFVNGRLRYWELKDEVDRLATALASMGVGRGSRVAIQLPNLPADGDRLLRRPPAGGPRGSHQPAVRGGGNRASMERRQVQGGHRR